MEMQFQDLIEAAPDGILVVNRTGRIVLANAKTEAMFGYTRDELAGKSVEMLLPARYREPHGRRRADFFMNPHMRQMGMGLELLGLRKDESEFAIEIALSPQRRGPEILVAAFIRDITERKQAEEAIRRLNEELEQRVKRRTAELETVNKELEAFSYSISHDLRSPLRALTGFSRILIEDRSSQLSAKANHYLEAIRDNAGQMGQLIDALLQFSRLGRQALNRQHVEPAHLARQSFDQLRSEPAGRSVDFVIGDLPACLADPLLLRQVLTNLLGNALKFTGKRDIARIEVGCLRDGPQTVYYVRDNGVGFDMRYQGKLFEVFQRLHRVDEFEGTGAGLAIVHRIITRHGGRIWAEAEVDRGASFYFTIGENAL